MKINEKLLLVCYVNETNINKNKKIGTLNRLKYYNGSFDDFIIHEKNFSPIDSILIYETVNILENFSILNEGFIDDLKNLKDSIRLYFRGDQLSKWLGKKFGIHYAKKMAMPIIVGSAAAFLGYILYKNFLSKAARECTHLTGSEKDKCIKNYHVNGSEERLKFLEKTRELCTKTEDVKKCQENMDKKIKKEKEHLQTLIYKSK